MIWYNETMQEDLIESVAQITENTSYLTWDLLVVVGLIVLICAYGFTLGKDFIVPLLVSVYIAGFVMAFVPYVDWLRGLIEADSGIASSIVFVGILLIVFFILKSNGFFEPYIVPTGFELATFCIGIAGLILVIVASFMGEEMIASFSPLIRSAFVGDIQMTVWALVPVSLLVLIRGET